MAIRHRRLLEGDTQIAMEELPDPVEVLAPDRLGQTVFHHDVVHGRRAQVALGEIERAPGHRVHHGEDGDRRQQ
jgi:hypothetical protein